MEFEKKIFFLSFLADLNSVWIEKKMLEWCFLIFLLFVLEFSSLGREGTEFRTKIFFSLSRPISAQIGQKYWRNDVFEFFCYFFLEFSSPGRVGIEFGTKIFFFFSFSAYLIPVLIEIMPESSFLIFWNFLLFFLEFSSPRRVGTEFGTKIFFSLSRPISIRIR